MFLRCQRQYAYLNFVIRNASFFRASAKFWLRWHYVLFCGANASTPILGNFALYHIGIYSCNNNPLLTIVHFGKTLWVYTRPAINLGSMLKHPLRVWAMPEWLPVCSWCIRPLFIVAMMQNDIWIMLQTFLLSILALRVLPCPTFQEYITCVPRNSASTLNRWKATSTPSWPRWRFRRPTNIVHVLHGC